jgi:hypothetical protein
MYAPLFSWQQLVSALHGVDTSAICVARQVAEIIVLRIRTFMSITSSVSC